MVTKQGKGFAARVASGLLHTVGLPELVTTSKKAYEALALELALNPAEPKKIRAELAISRETEPLFDTELFTKHIEEAYLQIHQRAVDGLEPETIEVSG